MIECNNLNFNYEQKKVFEDFNCQFANNQITAVVGPSGAGKTTLLRMIAGLETPLSGEIKNDKTILFSSKQNINQKPYERKIGMVFQDYILFSHMTVSENIAYGMNQKDENEIQKLLKMADLTGYDQKYPHELSGGEKQRVALLRSVAANPKVILLDEPFSNLDNEMINKLKIEIKNIQKEKKYIIVVVTHGVDHLKDFADQILSIKKFNKE